MIKVAVFFLDLLHTFLKKMGGGSLMQRWEGTRPSPVFLALHLQTTYRVSQKRRGAFGGMWHHIYPPNCRELNLFMQPRV